MAPTEILACQALYPDQVASINRRPRQQRPPVVADVFEVIGGGSAGGIKVRTARETTSAEIAERLATGSRIRAIEVGSAFTRLRYKLESGCGPATGWVSVSAQGRDLLLNLDAAADLNVPQNNAALKALCIYSERMALSMDAAGHLPNDGYSAGMRDFPIWRSSPDEYLHDQPNKPAVGAESLINSVPGDAAEKAENQDAVLCVHCQLPVGKAAYKAEDKISPGFLHGECMAQHMRNNMLDDETARKREDAKLKAARRAEYDIGWNGKENAPCNEESATRLGCNTVPKGMCCLVVDASEPATASVQVCATLEPGAAINLEYLSTALRVRREEGREPVFSLDPVDPGRICSDPDFGMQVKRFDPEWLAGTRVGEVMFQADYHLKELSMGEYVQPVLGMRSCFDLSEEEVGHETWSAREWFIVRKAEVHVSEDNVLVPYLKLGVEAREQFLSPDGSLEDVPITRDDHPLVRYAEDFTKYCDLICERKSVLYQLREVAKASVVAKFLMESGKQLSDPWFDVENTLDNACCLEVPQLWHDRCHSTVEVLDGTIVDTRRKKETSRRNSVYGGVDFGIDRFHLDAPSRTAASVIGGRISILTPPSVAEARMPGRPFGRLAGPISASSVLSPSRLTGAAVGPTRLAMPVSGVSMAGVLRTPSGPLSMSSAMQAPQGVDLSLNQFNLSEPVMASGALQCQDSEAVIGEAFWQAIAITGKNCALGLDEKLLLRDVFNPHLSDRRSDGNNFQPPATGFEYLARLRELVKTEIDLRRRRVESFASSTFDENLPGSLFPTSWTPTFQVSTGTGRRGVLMSRDEFRSEEGVRIIRDALSRIAPAFDRTAEDGTRFRIYRLGSTEVRTTQQHDEKEEILAVFAIKAVQSRSGNVGNRPVQSEKIVKVTEYIEHSLGGAASRNTYVVLWTEAGHAILTEKLADGSATWQENPRDLEHRNSLAKVIRTEVCPQGKITVSGIGELVIRENRVSRNSTSQTSRDQYAQIVFCRATGQEHGYSSGFLTGEQLKQIRSGKHSEKKGQNLKFGASGNAAPP